MTNSIRKILSLAALSTLISLTISHKAFSDTEYANHNQEIVNHDEVERAHSNDLAEETHDQHSTEEKHDDHGPMHQFQVQKLIDLSIGKLDVSLTNSSLMMLIITFTIVLTLAIFSHGTTIIPSSFQILGEAIYNFVKGIVCSTIMDQKEAEKHLPLIFSVFIFVLFSNILGLVPFSFTVTSHIAITGALSLVVFFFMIALGISRKGLFGFIKGLVPSGIPLPLIPLIFAIEVVAFLAKPFTLSIRLAANMTAGHTMLKVIIKFCVGLGVFAVIPLLATSAITAFELFIACLQAYIFTVLTSIYLNDSVSHAH